jgi:hypothetical protein
MKEDQKLNFSPEVNVLIRRSHIYEQTRFWSLGLGMVHQQFTAKNSPRKTPQSIREHSSQQQWDKSPQITISVNCFAVNSFAVI